MPEYVETMVEYAKRKRKSLPKERSHIELHQELVTKFDLMRQREAFGSRQAQMGPLLSQFAASRERSMAQSSPLYERATFRGLDTKHPTAPFGFRA